MFSSGCRPRLKNARAQASWLLRNFCRAKVASSFIHARNPFDIGRIVKNNHGDDIAIILFAQMPALSVLHFVIERSVLMALVFCYKGILDAKNPVILRMIFVTERTLLITCSAGATKSKNCHWMHDSSLGNTPISENHSLEFHEIWHEYT